MEGLGQKILLLVEDVAILAMSAKVSLQKYGYNVIVVHSGIEAIERIQSLPEINLVLMDIDLGPGDDGTLVAEKILKIRDIPVLFLSNHTEPEIVEKTEKITSYGYVVKNSAITVLDASIKMAFKLFEANKKLQTREKHLNSVIMAAPVALWELDSEGIILFSGGNALSKLGTKSGEHVGKSAFQLYASMPDALAMIKRGLSGEEFTVEIEAGKSFWKNYYIPKFDDKKKVVGLIGVSIDITDQKDAEIKIKESLDKYQNLFEMESDSILVIENETGRIVETNKSTPEMYGYTYSEFLKLRDVDLSAEPEKLQSNISKILNQTAKTISTKHKKKDGTVFPIEITARAFMKEGRSLRLVAIRDITERIQAEKSLKESEERFQLSMEATNDGLWDWNIQTDQAYFSPAYYQMLGYDPDNFLALGKSWQDLIHTEDIKYVMQANMDCIEGKTEKFEIEYRLKAKNGDWRWILGRGKCVMRDENHRALRLVGTHVDITDRKQTEDKIKSLLIEKDIILKEVHHRIKNNMNNMAAILSLQAENTGNQSVINALHDAISRLQSMGILYDKLYRTENIQTISVDIYLPSLIDEIVLNFQNRTFVKVIKKVENFLLDVNKLQAVGIIINELLTNILKYAFQNRSDGEIYVEVFIKTSKISDKQIAVFVIQDNGIGIPDSFDFENSPGFGLQLISLMTKQLKGKLSIEKNNGTKVSFEFEK